MQLTILTENCAGAGFLAEHGLSYLVETNGQKILFDTGHTNVFLKNAEKLDIDIQNIVKTIVLSHGHWDHGDGLRFLNGQKLVLHPNSFMKRYRGRDNSHIGLALSKNELNDKFKLFTSKEPYYISDKVVFLGEVPRVTEFESRTTPFIDDNNKPDYVPDDSAIAVIIGSELVIISGCAHSGICNIVLHAQKITGLTKVKALVGGFHLKTNNKQTKETIRFLKGNNIEQVYPSHCTELEAMAAFSTAFKIVQVKTGMIFNF